MSDPENFLTRWSRRKREPGDEPAQPETTPASPQPDQAQPPVEDGAQPTAARSPAQAEVPAPEFDLASLPSLDSIGASTDITAFMRAGVPSALRHAALRRAWVADPAIRDYVGPAREYAWDFTNPGSMPGFGELGPEVDVKKLVAELFNESPPAAEKPAEAEAPAPVPGQTAGLPQESVNAEPPPVAAAPLEAPPQQVAMALPEKTSTQSDEGVAPQQKDPGDSGGAIVGRRHGGAMPQ
jgi:hypothetical protein